MFNLLFDSEKICLFCLDNKEDLDRFICPECRSNVEDDYNRINERLLYLDECYYAAYYNRFIKRILHDFKFNDKGYLYKPLGEFVIEAIKRNAIGEKVDVISYIPLHRRKKAKRGYNQSELIALYISKKLNIQITHNLKKVKFTKEQHRLNRSERQTNLINSFKLKKGVEIMEKNILLIDDLITTGATLDECGRTLKEGGAKKVIAVCLSSAKE